MKVFNSHVMHGAHIIMLLAVLGCVFGQQASTVRGIILDQDGTAQPGARIIFTTATNTQKMIDFPTAASGTFTVSLTAGMRYNVRVMAPGYPLQYFDGASPDTTDDGPPPMPIAFNNGDSVTVHLSMTPKPVSPAYGFLMGKIYDSTGAPLAFARVTAMVPGRDVTAEVETDAAGRYSCRLPAQSHYIACTWYPYPTQFWSLNGTTLSPSGQGMISVVAGDSVRGVDMKIVFNPQGTAPPDSMNRQRTISGHVWDQLRALPAPGAAVFALSQDSAVGPPSFDPQTAVSPYGAVSDSTGYYSIINVPQGAYYVIARATGYTAQVYPYMDQPQQASVVRVDIGNAGNIDFGLRSTGPIVTQKGSVSGRVISTSGGQPIAGVIVGALLIDSVNSASITNRAFNPSFIYTPFADTAKSDGSYTIKNLPRGTYIVFAKGKNYLPQFFINADSAFQAKRIAIDTTGFTGIDFTLRSGAAISGRVLTKQGKGLSGATINANPFMGGFSSYAMTDSFGSFAITGLSAGKYCLYISGGNFLSVYDSNQCNYIVTDGATLSGITLLVDQGGIIMGPYTAPVQQDSLINMGFEMALFSDSLASKDSMLVESRTVWTNIFRVNQNHSTGWMFVSNPVPNGKWLLLMRPSPLHNTSSNMTQPFVAARGYCFGNGSSFLTQTPVTMSGGDTVRLSSVNFRTGYSVFGRVSLENNEKNLWCSITAYIKEGALFIPVCRTSAYSDSAFELPGLIDGQDYYIRIDAPNYPSQFWSSTASSIRPIAPYHFSTTSFIAPSVRAIEYPQGFIAAPAQLWASWSASDTGGLQIQCNASKPVPIDSIILYGKDTYGTAVSLASFPYSSQRFSYAWRETRPVGPGTSLVYVFVGVGPTLSIRSNPLYYFAPDTARVPADSLKISLTPTRTGVQISWRADSLFTTTSDTAVLYRKAATDTGWIVYKILWGSQSEFWDGAWDKTRDLGKTVYYQLKMFSGTRPIKQSAVASFTATQVFINQMADILPVGPTMKYATIQQAIDAARDFDIVAVEPGEYRENLSTRGKVISLQGNWTNGKAPVISGMGGTAITVPYTSKSVDKDNIGINGFKIQNCVTAIASSANINVNQCLFVNVVREAVQCIADSVAVVAAAQTDPFAQFQVNQNLWQCTFIGRGSQDIAVRAYSKTGAGAADTFSNIPKFSTPGAYVNVGNSIFAFYSSSFLPVEAKGSGITVNLQNCDFWQTSKAPSSGQVILGVGAVSMDPKFIDTIDYFQSDSSRLKITANGNGNYGYDVRRGYSGKNSSEPNIPAVTNFKAIVVGTRKIALSWSPLPDSVNIDGYIVLRVLGYDSLFTVNSGSQWQPKLPDSLVFSIVDTFHTHATSFIDSTLQIGTPYIYAVAGISASGNIGKVDLPFPPPLSAYIIKIDPLSSVPSLTAAVLGFSAVALQWKRPLFVKNATPTYSFYRIAGGQELMSAGKDSAAVRALVRRCVANALPSVALTSQDTVLIDSTAAMGASYLYVVSVVDSGTVFEQRPLAWTAVTIDSAHYQSQRTIRLMAGQWAMIGPWGLGAIAFNDSSSALYHWDDMKPSDKLYSQYNSAGSLRGCLGYWINPGADAVISISDSMYGNVVKQRDSISINLVKGQTGWNQIASPFPFTVAPHWLDNNMFTAYAWNADSAQYIERTQLSPWQACWVHIDRDTQLVFRASDAVRQGNNRHLGKHMGQAAWELKISLSGKSNDPDNYIGVAPGSHGALRLATLKPPQAFDFPQLYFLAGGESSGSVPQALAKLSKLYKTSAAVPREKLEWMVGISPAKAAMKVKLQGISSLPDNVHAFWVTASSVVNLREKAEIDVPAHKDPLYGYIVATANPLDLALYSNRVELRRSFPNPFRRSATLEFIVPYAWNADGSKKEGETRDVSLMLFNLHGRRVVTLVSGQVGVGEHRVVWNGLSDAGATIAPGMIIARLSGSNFQKTMKMFKIR